MSEMKKIIWLPMGIMALLIMMSFDAYASVTMVGTRVIYPAEAKEQVLRFSNPDGHPNLLQVWVDEGQSDASVDAVAPQFLVVPPVFRMEPNGGQVVRLSYVGNDLPQDRESLFFVNFLQVPAIKGSSVNDNQLVLTVRSRLKLFYRPSGLSSDDREVSLQQLLSFTLDSSPGSSRIVAHNRSAYYVVIQQASLSAGGQELEVIKSTMIPPFQDVAWPLSRLPADTSGLAINLKTVNDFGAEVLKKYSVH